VTIKSQFKGTRKRMQKNGTQRLTRPDFVDREHYSCPHSLAKTEVFHSEKRPGRSRNYKLAYACIIPFTKKHTEHKDSTGRVWS
jgi:hypothetical protein